MAWVAWGGLDELLRARPRPDNSETKVKQLTGGDQPEQRKVKGK